jgi:hypothetical protein
MQSRSRKILQFTKEARGKIWIRTGLLVIFGTLFGLALSRDLLSGVFTWTLGLVVLLPSLAVGFWMSRLVPMQVHQGQRIITFTLDKIYFVLIWMLVIAKLLTGRFLGLPVWSDALMVVIIGLMSGRLSGICLRVRALKTANHFI